MNYAGNRGVSDVAHRRVTGNEGRFKAALNFIRAFHEFVYKIKINA